MAESRRQALPPGAGESGEGKGRSGGDWPLGGGWLPRSAPEKSRPRRRRPPSARRDEAKQKEGSPAWRIARARIGKAPHSALSRERDRGGRGPAGGHHPQLHSCKGTDFQMVSRSKNISPWSRQARLWFGVGEGRRDREHPGGPPGMGAGGAQGRVDVERGRPAEETDSERESSTAHLGVARCATVCGTSSRLAAWVGLLGLSLALWPSSVLFSNQGLQRSGRPVGFQAGDPFADLGWRLLSNPLSCG